MSRRPERRAAALAALLALAAAPPGCGGAEPVRGPSVVLVTVDTLRADRLGAYGSELGATPHLDRLAAESVVFERAYAHAPFTAPSHASLFTSLYPEGHGVVDWARLLSERARTLAERFRDAGWRTGAFYNHPSLSLCGLERGFEHVERRAFEPADRTVDGFLDWLDRSGEPFAAWIHVWEVHRPYAYRDYTQPWLRDLVDPPLGEVAYCETRFGGHDDLAVGRTEAWYNVRRGGRGLGGEEDWSFVESRYDGGVACADAELGRLFDALRERGVLDETLVVVTSDHGESLRERDACWFTHDPFLYEETLRVPLLVRFPGASHAGARVQALARHVDVLPTALEAAGLPADGVLGASLLDLVERPRARDLPLYAETRTRHAKESDARVPDGEEGWLERREAVSDGRYKLIRDVGAGTTELYDLAADPGETADLSDDPDHAAARARLEELLRGFRTLPRAAAASSELSEPDQSVLQGLGYVGSG